MENLLKNYYYNINESTSFLPEKFLLKKTKSESPQYADKSLLNQWYLKQLTHQVYKPLKKKYLRNPIVSKYIDHLWNCDLV